MSPSKMGFLGLVIFFLSPPELGAFCIYFEGRFAGISGSPHSFDNGGIEWFIWNFCFSCVNVKRQQIGRIFCFYSYITHNCQNGISGFYGFPVMGWIMRFIPSLSLEQMRWLEENGFELLELISRGKSSGIWKVKKNGKLFALKIEHSRSSRTRMLERECYNLRMANEINVGPKLETFDSNAGIIVMQFIDGIPFGKWLMNCDDEKKMQSVLEDLLEQAGKLDSLQLDHGQLGGKLANILVDKSENVWMVDFEKAGLGRKPHNVSKLYAVLFKSNRLEKKHLLGVLGKKDFDALQSLFYSLSFSNTG